MRLIHISVFITFLFVIQGCSRNNKKLQVVSYNQFEAFIEATGYVTDAEKFKWSIVQTDVYNFRVVDGATWRKPDGVNAPESVELPVTQVSFNDAMAYCKWSNTRLPTYEEYWGLIKNDKRKVITNNMAPITRTEEANILGNVWEITSTTVGDSTRLAGGSVFCSKNTCHGTSPDRELYVDKQTGNIHIGFAVVVE
jgi:formylglycine-generating enzyme required for sulfatase activity